MKNQDKQIKKPYVRPQIEVREGFEKNVLQSGCAYLPNLAGPCGWTTPSG